MNQGGVLSLEDLGWRQASAFYGDAHPALASLVPDASANSIYIVLPYSCAVVNMDFKRKEPTVELLRAQKVDARDRGIQWGRNPRKIQLEIESGAAFLNAEMRDRIFVTHDVLLEFQPNPELVLASKQIDILKYWISRRYIRNAFPTEFNSRAGSVLKGYMNSIKSQAAENEFLEDVLGIYLNVDPMEELNPGDGDYEVEIMVLVSEAGMVGNSSAATKDSAERLRAALVGCDGITVADHSVQSETGLLLSEYRELTRVDDYDFISLREEQSLLEPLP